MSVRTVWYNLFLILTKHTTPFELSSNGKTKYTTPFEVSYNGKENIPHSSNCHKRKDKIYHTVQTVIKRERQLERCGMFCFSFYDSSNGVVYLFFHFMTVRTVWCILFFFYDSSNGVVCFVLHFMTVRTVWCIFHFMTVRTVWNILFFIL
jgi:hypothetical protein